MDAHAYRRALGQIAGLRERAILILDVMKHDLDGIEKAVASVTTRRPERRFEVEKRLDGFVVRRLPSLEQARAKGSVGRPARHDFSKMVVGEVRKLDLDARDHTAVRSAVARANAVPGMNVVARGAKESITVYRLAEGATLPAEPGQGYGMPAMADGAVLELASSPDIDVAAVRRMASYYGRRLGCHFRVVANGIGGCTITRMGEGAAPPPRQAPRVREIPPAREPAPAPAQAFDEEEF